jgi:hypothetical protein
MYGYNRVRILNETETFGGFKLIRDGKVLTKSRIVFRRMEDDESLQDYFKICASDIAFHFNQRGGIPVVENDRIMLIRKGVTCLVGLINGDFVIKVLKGMKE